MCSLVYNPNCFKEYLTSKDILIVFKQKEIIEEKHYNNVF